MDWFPFLTFVCVTTFTPGPNNLMSATIGGSNGYRAAFPFLSGVLLGFLVLNLACLFFIDTVFALLPQIEGPLRYIGAAFILYLAWKVLTAKPAKKGEVVRVLSGREGFLLQFANPKAIFFAITVSSTFIVPHVSSKLALIALAFFLASLTFLATSGWAIAGSLIRSYLEKPVPRKVFNTMMALLLLYSAVAIVGV